MKKGESRRKKLKKGKKEKKKREGREALRLADGLHGDEAEKTH